MSETHLLYYDLAIITIVLLHIGAIRLIYRIVAEQDPYLILPVFYFKKYDREYLSNMCSKKTAIIYGRVNFYILTVKYIYIISFFINLFFVAQGLNKTGNYEDFALQKFTLNQYQFTPDDWDGGE